MMSPDAIRTAAFGLEIPRMIAVYIGLTAAGALCGGVLAWILKTTDQPAKSWRALQKSVAGNEAIRRIRFSSGGTDKVCFPVPKAGSEFHNPRAAADINTPGKQAPALAIPGLPPPPFVGAAQMAVAGSGLYRDKSVF